MIHKRAKGQKYRKKGGITEKHWKKFKTIIVTIFASIPIFSILKMTKLVISSSKTCKLSTLQESSDFSFKLKASEQKNFENRKFG